MMDLCRQLGHNLTSTDKDVIATEFRLGGESYRASVPIVFVFIYDNCRNSRALIG